jgi:hypothetical protein
MTKAMILEEMQMTCIDHPATWPVLVAIDIARQSPDARIQWPSGKTRATRISNTPEGYQCLLDLAHTEGEAASAAFEPTADYHRNLAYRLNTHGVQCFLASSLACARAREMLFKTWDKHDRSMAFRRGHGVAQLTGCNPRRDLLTLKRPKSRQLGPQPFITRYYCLVFAAHFIRPAGKAASGGSLFNEFLSSVDSIPGQQVFVLVAQMRLRGLCIVPGAVAIKFAGGAVEIAKQEIDFDLYGHGGIGLRRRCHDESQHE